MKKQPSKRSRSRKPAPSASASVPEAPESPAQAQAPAQAPTEPTVAETLGEAVIEAGVKPLASRLKEARKGDLAVSAVVLVFASSIPRSDEAPGFEMSLASAETLLPEELILNHDVYPSQDAWLKDCAGQALENLIEGLQPNRAKGFLGRLLMPVILKNHDAVHGDHEEGSEKSAEDAESTEGAESAEKSAEGAEA